MKRTLSILILLFTFGLAGYAAERIAYFSGAWWETQTPAGHPGTVSAGEIRVAFWDDGVASAEREDDDIVFDFCLGTWTAIRNRAGTITSYRATFSSDFDGEVFTVTVRNTLLKGKFKSASGWRGNVQARAYPLESPTAARVQPAKP
jgi:hypothetical protein